MSHIFLLPCRPVNTGVVFWCGDVEKQEGGLKAPPSTAAIENRA